MAVNLPSRIAERVLPDYRGTEIDHVRVNRRYVYRVDGRDLPTVTTILKVIDKSGPLVGWARKDALDKMEDELGERGSVDYETRAEFRRGIQDRVYAELNVARDQGTAAHAAIMALLQGDSPDMPEEVAPAATAALSAIEGLNWAPLDTEVMLWHPHLDYGGTFDLLVAQEDGRLAIVDWKRSSGLYPEHAYQAAAYVRALNALGVENLDAFVVKLPRTPEEVYEVREVNVPAAFSVFMGARELFLAAGQHSKELWK